MNIQNPRSKDTYIYVGSYLSTNNTENPADSPAGNAVQSTIISALKKISEKKIIEILFYPNRVWPYASIRHKKIIDEDRVYPSYINISFIRFIIFYSKILIVLINNKPTALVQYNPNFLLTIIVILYKLIFNNYLFYVVIIQDIKGDNTLYNLSGIINQINMFFSKFSNFLIPITKKIAVDFSLPPSKTFVFSGGITNHSIKYISQNSILIERAVFAGSLETYNGVDKLIDQWIEQKINIPLHIFGKGSLAKYIYSKALNFKYIIYHGYINENFVADFCSNSKFNIILRYSIGINQNYFFPSKIYNLICTKGIVIANRFENIPIAINNRICYVNDDLFNLSSVISSSKLTRYSTQYSVPHELTWEYCANEIVSRIYKDS